MWSDNERCVSVLTRGMEGITRPSNSPEQVLEAAVKLLLESATVSADVEMGGSSEEEEEGEEEEEEEFDDYFDDFDQDLAEDEVVKKER